MATARAIDGRFDLDAIYTAWSAGTFKEYTSTRYSMSSYSGSSLGLELTGKNFLYDTYGNLQSYSAAYNPTSGAPTSLYAYTLTRDLAGRIVGKSETIGGVTDSYVYTFDIAGRLTAVTKNGSAYSSYVYDGNGNRTSGVTAGTAFTATYDAQDRLVTFNTRAYSYNANGDLYQINWGPVTGTSTFVYDAIGNLTQVTGAGGNVYSFFYDGRNRRVNKLQDAVFKYRYIYQDDYKIAATIVSGVVQRDFVFGSSINTPDYSNSYVSNIGRYRFIKDHLGSVRLVVNTSTGAVIQRMDYNDLGDTTADSNAGFQPYGYGGGIWDPTLRILKFGARDYEPETGRWTSKDPILFAGGDTNLYGYTVNDPINYIDPTGLTIADVVQALSFLNKYDPNFVSSYISFTANHDNYGSAAPSP
ncbi:MAG: hypothetical protein EOP06_18230, partial [Proteobacteria bacterium]